MMQLQRLAGISRRGTLRAQAHRRAGSHATDQFVRWRSHPSEIPKEVSMPQNLLEQLRKYTTVVADTGDFEAMEKFRPTDATTNPSLITAASQMPAYQELVDGVLKEARNEKGEHASDKDVAALAFERLAVAFGKRIL